MPVSIEQHVDWITNCIEHMRKHGVATIEATEAAENEWTAHVAEVANDSLLPQANSWYVGANIEGKPHVFMPYLGGVGPYRQKCDEVAANGYDGFRFLSEVDGSDRDSDHFVLPQPESLLRSDVDSRVHLRREHPA
jgi:cyclohexanone monooxygenase